MKPTSARFRKESNALLLRLGCEALAENRQIVSVDGHVAADQKAQTAIVLARWEASGLGHAVFEDDGYTTHAFFEFSDKGLRRVKLMRLQRSFRGALNATGRQGFNIIVAIASIIAAVAACASAYFSYLALSTK